MAAVLRDHARARAMSRSTLWRVLNEADLKPHRCVYWLNSHDPWFAAKARDICTLYVKKYPEGIVGPTNCGAHAAHVLASTRHNRPSLVGWR